jgi:hypothetical protein
MQFKGQGACVGHGVGQCGVNLVSFCTMAGGSEYTTVHVCKYTYFSFEFKTRNGQSRGMLGGSTLFPPPHSMPLPKLLRGHSLRFGLVSERARRVGPSREGTQVIRRGGPVLPRGEGIFTSGEVCTCRHLLPRSRPGPRRDALGRSPSCDLRGSRRRRSLTTEAGRYLRRFDRRRS